jgi:hypothetical protein
VVARWRLSRPSGRDVRLTRPTGMVGLLVDRTRRDQTDQPADDKCHEGPERFAAPAENIGTVVPKEVIVTARVRR